jgi:hypothetical protein
LACYFKDAALVKCSGDPSVHNCYFFTHLSTCDSKLKARTACIYYDEKCSWVNNLILIDSIQFFERNHIKQEKRFVCFDKPTQAKSKGLLDEGLAGFFSSHNVFPYTKSYTTQVWTNEQWLLHLVRCFMITFVLIGKNRI